MNDFTIIYKILKSLEKGMDYSEFDTDCISPERLGVTRERWEKILIMMQKNGYIEGVVITSSLSDYYERIAEPIRPQITLLGLEYLTENTMMKKAEKVLKGIKEKIPRL